MFKQRPLVRCLAIAFGGGMALSAVPAMAQQQEPQAQELQRVEITGSSVRRIQGETALPVQVMNRQDVEKTGATSVAELIQKLPAIQGYTEASESVGGGGGGFSSASLRGLGSQHTLVLLNGRRIAPWSGQTLTGYGEGVDLNTIPLAAIDRVEILTDGASALYGSDAVAGVINFILRKDFDKFDVSGGVVVPEAGGAEEKRISLTKGFGNLERDGYNVLLSYNHDEREQLKASDRDFAKSGIIKFGNGLTFFNGSLRGIPANYFDAADNLHNPYFDANGSCPARHVAYYGGCLFDYTSTIEIYPEQKRDSVVASFNKALGANHTLFAEYMWAKSQITARIAPPPVDIPISASSPYHATYIAPYAPGTGDVTAYWRLMDVGNRTERDTTEANHLVVGMKGLAWGWDYNAAYTRSENKYTQEYTSGWIASNELLTAIGQAAPGQEVPGIAVGTLNPFVGPGQQSAAGQATLNQIQFRGEYRRGKTTLDFVDVKGSRDVFKAPGGTAMLGLGIDFRREAASYDPSQIARGEGNVIAGDSGAERPFDVSRHAWGTFGELLVPFAKNLEVTGSLRYDDYSDFGTTTNGKLAMRWQPVRQLLVRASAGTGFKAPSVPQTANTQQLYGVTGGSYLCPFAPTDPLAAGCVSGPFQYNVFAAGNPDLKPEKSKQWTLGFVFEPNRNITASVDFWSISLKDAIGQIDESVVFGDPVTYRHLYTTYTDPTSGSTQLAVLLANTNLGKQTTSGIDFDVEGRVPTRWGRLSSRLLATYVTKNKYERIPGQGYYTDLGQFNDGGVTFRVVGKWINTLDMGNWSHSLTVNYKSGYKDQPQSADDCYVVDAADNCVAVNREVSAYTTVDWQTRWQITKQLKLTGGILNLFDKDPPLSLKIVGGHQLGYDNRYTDPRGRTYYLNLGYTF